MPSPGAGSGALAVDEGPVGLVLVHGFGGTPGVFAPVAEAARGAGVTLRAPVLPGHGTHVADLAGRTFGDWVEATATHTALLAERCEVVVVGGLSAGAAVAAAVAAALPVDGLVLVNALLEVDPDTAELVVEAADAGWDELPEPELDLAEPARAEGYACYDAIPVATLRSVHESLPGVLAGLGAVTAPSLLVASRNDHVVGTGWVEAARSRLRGPVQVRWLEQAQHVVPLDVEGEEAAAAIVGFATDLAS